jgi:hypothetical protein
MYSITRLVLFLLCMYSFISVTLQYDEVSHAYDRHNLGYVLRKTQSVHVFNAKAKLTFYLALPPKETLNINAPITCQNFSTNMSASQCIKIYKFIAEMYKLQTRAGLQLQRTIDSIQEFVDTAATSNRTRRSIWQMMTNALSSVTGLATDEDVQSLKTSVEKIDNITYQLGQTFQTASSHFSQIVNINTQRIREVSNLADLTRSSINVLFNRVAGNFDHFEQINTLLANGFRHFADNMYYLIHIESLRDSLQLLVAGKFPVELVSVRSLKSMLNRLDSFLLNHHSHLSIVHRDPLYYYREGRFVVVRRRNVVIFQMDCPLSSLPEPFQLHRMDVIPLFTHGSPGHYTQLATKFSAIAFNDNFYFVLPENYGLLNFPKNLDLNENNFPIIDRSVPTCPSALIDGDVQSIKSLCGYHIIHEFLRPHVVRLTERTVLLSNITTLTAICDDGVHDRSSLLSDVHVILTMPCACELQADEFYIPRIAESCASSASFNQNLSVSFLLNLPYLTEFFSTELSSVLPNHVFDIPSNVSVPPLPINSPEYDKQLALLGKSKFDLAVATNLSKQDTNMYTSVSHYLFNKVWDSKSWVPFSSDDHKDYWLFSLSAIVVFLCIAVIYLFSRLRILSLTLLLLSQARSINGLNSGLNLRYSLPTPSTTTVNPNSLTILSDWLTYLEIEHVVIEMVIIIVLFIFAICLWVYQFHHSRRILDPRIELHVGNSENIVKIFWKTIPYKIDAYNINVSAVNPTVQIISGIVPRIHLLNTQVQFTHLALFLSFDLPIIKILAPFSAKMLRKITKHQYFVAVVIHDGNLQVVVPIRKIEPNTTQLPPVTSPSPRPPSLYPSLTVD